MKHEIVAVALALGAGGWSFAAGEPQWISAAEARAATEAERKDELAPEGTSRFFRTVKNAKKLQPLKIGSTSSRQRARGACFVPRMKRPRELTRETDEEVTGKLTRRTDQGKLTGKTYGGRGWSHGQMTPIKNPLDH